MSEFGEPNWRDAEVKSDRLLLSEATKRLVEAQALIASMTRVDLGIQDKLEQEKAILIEALRWYSNLETKSPIDEWSFKNAGEDPWQNIWNKAREALAKVGV